MPGVAEPHPLLALLMEAALGRPPAADGVVELMPRAGPTSAIVAFTAHHAIAADVAEDQLRGRLPPDDLGAPMLASFQLFLAGWVGAEPGFHDVVLALPPGAVRATPVDLEAADTLGDHRRVQRASCYRSNLTVWTDPSGAGVLVVGRGLAGRWEMAFEVDDAARGRGLGHRLAAAAGAVVPDGDIVFAQVSPGNVASLRAVLAAGYRPIASEVLFTPR